MSMEYKNVYGIVVTWQNLTTWKETCSSVSLSTTNPTWTGHGVKLCRVSKNVLCYIIPCVNIEFFLHPLQIHNGCPSLFYQTTPRLQHTRVVCCSPKCSYLSFPNGSTWTVTSTSIYKSLFCTKIGHLQSANWWASEIPVLQKNMLPPTWSLLALKMEATCSSKIFVSNNSNIWCHNPRHWQCETLKYRFITHTSARHRTN